VRAESKELHFKKVTSQKKSPNLEKALSPKAFSIAKMYHRRADQPGANIHNVMDVLLGFYFLKSFASNW